MAGAVQRSYTDPVGGRGMAGGVGKRDTALPEDPCTVADQRSLHARGPPAQMHCRGHERLCADHESRSHLLPFQLVAVLSELRKSEKVLGSFIRRLWSALQNASGMK